MSIEALAILPLGFALGLVHALDADHVMAVSAMASRERKGRRSWLVSILWSLGHSGSLFLIACLVLPLGLAIPPELARYAEAFIGVAMIGLGIYTASGLMGKSSHIHFHSHEGLPSHAHWHVHAETPRSSSAHTHTQAHAHNHMPVMMGVLHGCAGSAPLFALIPSLSQESPLVGFAYVLCFGVGVLLAMLIFGGLLGHVLDRTLQHAGGRGVRLVQGLAASGSIVLGSVMIGQSL